MKIHVKIAAILGCIFFIVNSVHSQNCIRNFTVNTTVTPSTCQSNGTITVTLSGATPADTMGLYQKQYSLQPNTPDGFSLPSTPDNVLIGIPPGTYTVIVSAFCDIGLTFEVMKTATNVVVSGNYKVPELSFVAAGRINTYGSVAPTSRKSYAGCATGKIVMQLKNGNQTTDPIFRITDAPASVTVPQTVSVSRYSSGSLTTGYIYSLNGLYPAGNYTVEIDDGCYVASKSFELGELSTLPISTLTEIDIRPYPEINLNCSLINLSVANPDANVDFYQYFRDTLYEIGAAPQNQIPANWTTWTYNVTPTLNLSPYNISYFYTNRMSVYIRVKNCPAIQKQIDLNIRRPSLYMSQQSRNCNNVTARVSPWTDYDGVICYPITYTVKNQTSGDTIYQLSNITNIAGLNAISTYPLNYETSYVFTVTDHSGYSFSYTAFFPLSDDFTWVSTDLLNCNTYQAHYSDYYFNCYPVYVTIKNQSNSIVALDTIYSTNRYSPPLMYDTTYTFTFTYPNRIINGSPYSNSRIKYVANNKPSGINLSIFNYSYYEECDINEGSLRVWTSPSGRFWPAGTVITITGPAPFGTHTYTEFTSTNDSYLFGIPIPPGSYTVTADLGCGTPLVSTVNLQGVYDVQNFTYTTENTCSGMKVTPSGTLTHYGNPATIYYRLLSGPAGYDQSVIGSGGSFTFSSPGTYVLGVIVNNSSSQCALKTDTIVYTAPPMSLNLTKTAAYACVGSDTGNISLQATNGVLPYTYELWNRDNTVQLQSAVTSSGIVNYYFGNPDSTYTIRVRDSCGSSFSQQLTIADLKTAKIVFPSMNPVCYGSNISLNCLTLGQTTYNWTGPNGFTSTQQNPVIPNADASKSGWYKVSVDAEFCGDPVYDSLYIVVYDPINLKTYENDTIKVAFCSNERIILGMAATGGSGNFTYQWARSTNGTSWTNISGETNAVFISANTDYIFPSTTTNPAYTHFRCTITDAACGSFNVYYHTRSKPCYIPVNPNLMNLPPDSPLQKQKQ